MADSDENLGFDWRAERARTSPARRRPAGRVRSASNPSPPANNETRHKAGFVMADPEAPSTPVDTLLRLRVRTDNLFDAIIEF